MSLACIIMAAGKGKRMNSDLPKACHSVGGLPIICHVLEVAKKVSANPIVIVLGHNGDEVEKVVCGENVKIVWQNKLLGTGDAVKQALPAINGVSEHVLILAGDTPLLRASTVENMITRYFAERPSAVLLTCEVDNPKGYGRIIRDSQGRLIGIVEEADSSEEQKRIKEVNAGVYLVKSEDLVEGIKFLQNNNAQKEYYFPKIIDHFVLNGKKVETVMVEDPEEITGVNTRAELAAANKIFFKRKAQKLMNQGVTIIDPETVYIEYDVMVGKDSIIYPNTYLKKGTVIGERCEIGPNSQISASTIGNGIVITNSVVEGSVIEDNAKIGPFAYLRPETVVKRNAKVGTFVEVKKTVVGQGSKVPHLSYMGDAIIGEKVNIGAGSITCNYDGESKYETIIEDKAFIGSDTMFIAPVRIGKGAFTGAGSVITEDLPEESLGIARARQLTKKGWARKKKKRRKGNSTCE